jgi:hypothetical protein
MAGLTNALALNSRINSADLARLRLLKHRLPAEQGSILGQELLQILSIKLYQSVMNAPKTGQNEV